MSTNLNSDGTTTTLMTASERVKVLRAEIAQRDAEIERLRARVEVLEKALHRYANDYKNGHCARIALSHSSSLSTSSLEAKP
jgi:multidrug resistance efflux pump